MCIANSSSTFDHGYHYPDITLDGTKETTEEEVRLKVMRLYGPRPENANARYPTGAIELANITPFPEWAKELPGMMFPPRSMNIHFIKLTYRSQCRYPARVDRVLQG